MKLLADHIIDTMNADFAERQLFGGTSAGATPYVVHDRVIIYDGNDIIYDSNDRNHPDATSPAPPVVTYNGVPVNISAFDDDFSGFDDGVFTIEYFRDGVNVDKNGKSFPATYDPQTTPLTIPIHFETAREKGDNSLIFPGSNPIFVDIGMGIKYIAGEDQFGEPTKYNVDPQTAMDISLNGAKMLGSGYYGGNSYNVAQALYDAAHAMYYDHRYDIVAAIDALDNSMTNMMQSITTLGAKQISIEFYQMKNDDYEFSLKERQNEVEGVDMYDEITYYMALEAAFQAALQLSSRVLPRSVFDFV